MISLSVRYFFLVLIALTPAFAHAQDGTGSTPPDASMQPASVATTSPASVATTSAPRPSPSAQGQTAPAEPITIQLATVTVEVVATTSPLAGTLPIIVAVLTVVVGAFVFLRGKFSKQDTDDKRCDDIRSLLEQKKKELEAFVKEWPAEKLKETALKHGIAQLEKNETLAPGVRAAMKAKETYDTLETTIETLTRRYDLCMLSLPPTPNPDIEVRDSKIEGKGVFALRDFVKGERVVEWGERKVLSDEEYGKLSDDYKRRYVSMKDGKRLLSGEPMRYVNHSCNANTSPKEGADVALRDISAGEEVTSDYTNFGGEDLACNCGSEGCRGEF